MALGKGTLASNDNSTAIGYFAKAFGFGAVSLGVSSQANGDYSVAIGNYAKANGSYSMALGFNARADGVASLASGEYTLASGADGVAIGNSTEATNNAFAAGTFARAIHDGAFVWADQHYVDFNSTSNNQFLIRAEGGVGINNNNPGTNALRVAGTVLATKYFGDGSGLTGISTSFTNFSSAVSFTNAANLFVGSFTGNGTNLTNSAA